MKHYFKWLSFLGIMVLILNVLPKTANAQIDPGEDPDAPIDGGVSLLVAAGVGYGVKKYRDNKKNKQAKF